MLIKRTRRLGLHLLVAVLSLEERKLFKNENLKWRVRPESRGNTNSMLWSE